MTDSLDGLATFFAVARHNSFTAAAASLSVTPTAVSQKIKVLERRLGVVLFQRTTRRVALTEPGAALFERLRPALGEIEDALAGLGAFRGRPSGRLRITAPRTSSKVLAPLITGMSAAYPELGLEVSLDDAFVDLVAGGFDAGIRLGDSIEKDMVRIPLTKDTAWSIVGSPAYLDQAGRPKTPEQLVEHRTVRQRMIATGVIYRWELERRGKSITIDVPGGPVVDDVGLLIALAREGAGLVYVADDHIETDVQQGRLERVLEPYLAKGPPLCLFFPARMQEQPKLRALLEMMKTQRASRNKRRG